MSERARPVVVVEIPDPALVVLVGAAGAGKTTFAARHFAPDEVLSSDALREAISGDADDQRASGSAFGALHRALARRLRDGRLTVVDATNVTAPARRALLGRAARADIPAIAVVLDLPATVVVGRNAARPGRTVPEDVVRRQLAELRGSMRDGLDDEGFAAVVRLGSPEDLDAARVVRIARRPDGSPGAG